MLAASTKLVRSWTRKLWSYCNALLCISSYFSPLHFFASLSPLHFVSLLVDGGPAVRLADKGGVRVIWRARRDFFLLSFEIIYCRMLYIVSHLKNFFFHNWSLPFPWSSVTSSYITLSVSYVGIMDYIENNNRMIALPFEVSTIRLLLALVCQQQQHRPSGASFAFRLTLSCPSTYHGVLEYSTRHYHFR